MIDAKKMRVLTKQAIQDIEAQEKLRKAKAFDALERWWHIQGYPNLLRTIEACGREGKSFYTMISDEKHPEFVLENLIALGFSCEVSHSNVLVQGTSLGAANYVLKVSW